MDNRVIEIINLIKKEGYDAYLVGGGCRDELLGIPYFDIDITTNAHPDVIINLFEVKSDKGKPFGNVKIVYKGLEAEITTFRKETYYYPSVYPKIQGFCKTIKEDYVRRDFTVNALYMDENQKVIDPCNGLKDLHNKTLDFILNPQIRIKEDPSRILRAIRLKEKLKFEFSKKTKQAILENVEQMLRLSKNKLANEIKKTYDECGIIHTNKAFDEFLITETLFGYKREFVSNNASKVDLDTILAQLKSL